MKKKNEDFLTLDQIVSECAPVESKAVAVPGFSKPIQMKNISFEDFTNIKLNAVSPADVNARTVALATGLSMSQVREMMNGNAFKFTMLLGAVNRFLGFQITDEELAKLSSC